MTEGTLIDRAEQMVDVIVRRGDASYALKDDELAPLARVAADLRDYPGPQFKARLRASLERRATMAMVSTDVREGVSTITPYIRVEQPGLAEFMTRVFGAAEINASQGGGRVVREMRIADSMIVVDEAIEGAAQRDASSRPAEFHVYVEDVDAIFARALAAGATSIGDPAVRPYGERAGFVRDAFGNHWFIARHLGASYVPEGFRTVTPFVHAKGAAQYVEFLKHAFDAVEELRQDIGGGAIRYARLRIGNAAIELGEAEGGIAATPATFQLTVGNPDVWYRQAIAAGATALPAPAIGVEDPVGSRWLMTRRA